jgi:hypothetical protein
MKTLPALTLAATLALPATAIAAQSSGVVLSVDKHAHAVELVDSSHVVHSYHYRGQLPRVGTGSRITFSHKGLTVSHVRTVKTGSGKVSFLGRVVRSNKRGLVLRLADGKTVRFTAGQIRRKPAARKRTKAHRAADRAAAASVTINITGLQPGAEVLVTESVDASGNVTVTIAFPSTSAGSGTSQASGTVIEVDSDAYVLQTGDGSDLRLHVSASTLASLNLQPCSTADVTYHQDGGMLIADSTHVTGSSSTGDCANADSQDAVGTITNVSRSSVTVSTQDGHTLTFGLQDSSVTDGYSVGDVVDVSYFDNGDGTLSAYDVEYTEQDVTGTVTAVSASSLTLTDDSSGQPRTFTANPADGLFDGTAVGDHVDVTVHTSAGQSVVDSVSVDDGSASGN